MSRNGRSRLVLPYPDNDATIENIREILRWKNPRFDIARMRLKEAQKSDPRNPKLFQLEVDLSVQEGKKDFDAASIWNRAIEECAVPDLFHHQATLAIRKNARGKAVTALEAGVQLFADNARLRRRLASLQISQNRLEDARDTLKMAQEIEPMMPDAYSLLAEVYMRMGTEHLEDAHASLEEAMRLDPEGSQHHARQGELHRFTPCFNLSNEMICYKRPKTVIEKHFESSRVIPEYRWVWQRFFWTSLVILNKLNGCWVRPASGMNQQMD